MKKPSEKQRDELLAKALDGRLAPAEQAEFERQLIRDATLRQAYLDLVVLDSYLELEHPTQSELNELPIHERPTPQHPLREVETTLGFFRRPTPFSLAVAATVMVLVIATMAVMVAPIYRTIANRARPNQLDPQRIVARLTGQDEAVWVAGQVATHRGAFLPCGRRLELESGLAEVTFDSGAKVLLQGPATFEVETEMASRLTAGSAVVKVSPQARGFIVSTPTSEIVDLGTEFAVDVAEDSTNVAVFQGAVTVAMRREGTMSAAQRIAAGSSAKVSGDKIDFRETIVLDRRVIRELPPPLVTSVASSTGNPYRFVRAGLREDARAYTDEPHQWNGVDEAGIPPELLGADLIRTANLDRDHEQFDVSMTISRPATVYVFLNKSYQPPAWLTRDFEKTELKIGLDAVAGRGWPKTPGVGAGESVDIVFHVWRRNVDAPGTISLGPTQPRGAVFGIALRASDTLNEVSPTD